MSVNIATTHGHIRHRTDKLLKRMLNPCFGMMQEVGILGGAYNNPSLIVAGGVLTGVHVLQNKPDPGRVAYHIGGCGIFLEESMIKTLAEGVERYAQLLSEISQYFHVYFTSYQTLADKHEPIISKEKLQLFTEEQLQRPRFAFQAFSEDKPISWVPFYSLIHNRKVWVPAQLAFFGYQVRMKDGEPWFGPGMSTGTAAHVSEMLARKNAILELIQLDSTMGHWYTNYPAYEIVLDERTQSLQNIIDKIAVPSQINMKFFLLNNPDLKGFTVAALFYNNDGHLPKAVIGLGADTSLQRAMYKALLEGVGTLGLARLEIFKREFTEEKEATIDPKHIYDLDANCEYYGRGHNFDLIKTRFLDSEKMQASQLPSDIEGTEEEQFEILKKSFADSGKDLLEVDMNIDEVKTLGFKVIRLWSPDTLSLCLPSFVPKAHPRFKSYGGVQHEAPHPYP